MKIVSSFLLLFILSQSFAQNTYDWSMSNSKWSYQVEGQIAGGGLYWSSPMKREVTFDQILTITGLNGAFNYDKYNFFQFSIDPAGTNCCPMPSEVYLKLYNDVLYYQVPYAVNNTMGYLEDDTIVNFNAEIGDKWSFHDPFLIDPVIGDTYYPYDNQTAGITSVLDTGSRVISGESLKWIYVEYQVSDANGVDDGLNYTDTIFERIGPKRNLIPSEYFYGMDSPQQGGAHFACYSDDNFAEYVENANICYAYVGMTELQANYSFEISPNPSSGLISIQFDEFEMGDLTVLIKDVNGREVDRTLVQSSYLSYQFGNIQEGIYFVHILSDGVRLGSEKVMLIR
ncbi:MAG: hypothetical protein ACI8Q1_001917 [Parvicella sp.]|jgi:hypothetical protein